jgi:septum formation protein
MKQLILASQSSRRKQLLKALGVKFTVAQNSFREMAHLNGSPQDHAIKNALGKARAVAAHHKNALIIGADTVVVFRKKVLEKPRDLDEAALFLNMLQGNTHTVYTGLALIDVNKNKTVTDYEKTRVTMRALSEKEINSYLKLIKPLDKAGAYAIQGAGSIIIKKIDGCYYNVVGFPIARLEEMMHILGVSLFQFMN